MAYDNRRAQNPPAHQSIPLQDLSRPPDESISSGDWGYSRRESVGRARTLLGSSNGFTGRRSSGRYERVLASSSNEGYNSDERLGVPHITTPRTTHQPSPSFDDGEMSPVNVGDFQAAMGSVGLSFDTPSSRSSLHSASPPPSERSHLGPIVEREDLTPPLSRGTQDTDEYFPSQVDDRSPLTDVRYLQPISGSPFPPAPGQRHDRMSGPGRYSSSMLGDDLGNSGGSGFPRTSMNRLSPLQIPPTVSRSLATPTSPLNSAGSMLRKMSQRVVNLSNEPEVIEQSMREQQSAEMATLDAPPFFPAMTEYAHDEPSNSPSTTEKGGPFVSTRRSPSRTRKNSNPLKGNSLGLFPPNSRVRLWLCELLVHPFTEPVILVLILLQTVLLAIEAATTITLGNGQRTFGVQATFFSIFFLVLFIFYTLEIAAKVVVSGLVINPIEYSSSKTGVGVFQAIRQFMYGIFSTQKRSETEGLVDNDTPEAQMSILRSFTMPNQPEQSGFGRHAQRLRLARRAFLRHSFNRLDLLAVVAFWISILLSRFGSENHDRQVLYLFKMLSCLRILRLLSLTTGTSVILRSLKKAAPLLVHVGFLISFFWLLFAVVGIQTFKSSFRRSCVFLGENATALLNVTDDQRRTEFESMYMEYAYNQNDGAGIIQFCGAFIHPSNGSDMPYLTTNLVRGPSEPKGYRCPQGSLCLENTQNIYNNTVSFDNIIMSLEMVFVIMSSNTWSNLLYLTTDSDNLAAALYFVLGIIILSFWLISLLIAVITSSFQVIREESKTSAFTTDDQVLSVEEDELPNKDKKKSLLKRIYEKTYWVWIVIIIISLVIQSLATANSSDRQEHILSDLELAITIVLLFEMFLRFVADWRNFHKSARNWVDLLLAVITTIIQIPTIRESRAYDWMTVFQILRIYRVVLAVPMVRDLVVVVLGNVSGIFNLIIFVVLATFLSAIFAVQLLRGELPQEDGNGNFIRITFGDIWNSFIGMYQVLSSENWTSVLYTATEFENENNAAWISALFFILWFTFANFIILNMFIAVIQENFDVSEDEKRLHQVKAFLQQRELTGSTHSNMSLSAIFRLGRDKTSRKDPIEYGPAVMEKMFKDNVVRDFLDEQMEALDEEVDNDENHIAHSEVVQSGYLTKLWSRLKRLVWKGEPNPFYSDLTLSKPYEDLDARDMVKEIAAAADQRKKDQRLYLQRHPRYNVSLFVFRYDHPLRKLCQQMVGPGRGSKRIEGVDPVKSMWYTFSIFIYACIVAMVLIACIATPLYQRDYFMRFGGIFVRNWFVWTDMAFAAVFTLEAMIKIIADGFFWTPHAYFRGIWGLIDGVVLLTLWISVAAALFDLSDIARTVGAFKALRALRLLNVSDSARNTFHSVIILGGWKVLSAAFVSISLLVPFAIYGLNLFKGRFLECNDGTITNITRECSGEYLSEPYNWQVYAPRVAANPYYDFDNFGDSLFILFQIVSQEGWTDTMWSAINARDPGIQPADNASVGNAVFFLVFNLLGAVFVLTLFVSVFMRNYTEQTGVAFLTTEQRSWLELRKLLRQISPSKRPKNQDDKQPWKNRCYRIAVSKHGKWARLITGVLILHLVLLLVEFYPEVETWELIRNILFTIFVALYIINIIIRIVGLTWKRFRRSSWDFFSLFSVSGTVILTILRFANKTNATIGQLQRLFLVSISLLLIPRNNQLDQLFKTAAASFSAIANLLLTWFVLFLVWAIAMTQTLGLTRFGSQSRPNLNLRTVPKALILLFRTSVGEGWNEIMENFASATPPLCIAREGNFYESDCGSSAWARFLFVSWNIISMYIFTSIFISLIFESFSYVYQRSGGISTLSREEIRRFKQAWATFDPDGTEYISKDAFPKFLGELSGVFEMRIYDGEHTVGRIIEDCRVDDSRVGEPQPGVIDGISLARLNQRLSTINVPEIRRRRERLNLFSQEVLVSADPDRGIAFSTCLMILAHHNLINDSKSLRLEEFLRRRYRLQRVQEEVQRRVVTGFFDTLFWSRQFSRRKDLRSSARMVTVPQFAVPEILVDDPDSATPSADTFPVEAHLPAAASKSRTQPDPSPMDGLSPHQASSSASAYFEGFHGRGQSLGTFSALSPTSFRPRANSEAEHGGRSPTADGATEISQGDSTALDSRSNQGTRHRRQQSSVNSQRTMTPMEAFDNSAWGESIRRSFTVRRSNTRGKGKRMSRPPAADV